MTKTKTPKTFSYDAYSQIKKRRAAQARANPIADNEFQCGAFLKHIGAGHRSRQPDQVDCWAPRRWADGIERIC